MSQRPHSPTLSEMECDSPTTTITTPPSVPLTADRGTSPLPSPANSNLRSSAQAVKESGSPITAQEKPNESHPAQVKTAAPKPTTITLTINPPPAAANATAGPKPDTSRKLARYLTDVKSEAFIAPMFDDLAETLNQAKRECPSIANVPNADLALRLRFDGPHPPSVQGTLFRVSQASWPNAITDVLPLIHIGLKTPIPVWPPANDQKATSDPACNEGSYSVNGCCKKPRQVGIVKKAFQKAQENDEVETRRLTPNALFEVHMKALRETAQGQIEYLKMCERTRQMKVSSKCTKPQDSLHSFLHSQTGSAIATGDDGLGDLERAIKAVHNRASQVDVQRRAEEGILDVGEMTWNDLCREGTLLEG